jgi:hypothetical protein
MPDTAAPPASWTIRQDGDTWQLACGPLEVGAPHATYQAALAALAAELAAAAPEAPADGLLPEPWHSPAGIAFSTPTGDGRDFSATTWSWRDPEVSLLPLMFQDRTDMGHFGAELAGYIGALSDVGGTIHAEGRFYDTEQGRAARDLLLGGRRFGVSVDPGAVEATWECVAEDDDGWCTEERIDFQAYEVIGLTMTPFPAFASAAIELAGSGAAELAVAPADHAFTDDNGDGNCDACLAEDDQGNCTQVCDLTEDEHTAPAEPPAEGEASVVVTAASAVLLVAPPAAWFAMPEPQLGDPLLLDQGDGTWAVPLTITDDGQVYGHVARWGQCHTGYADCKTPPAGRAAYRGFHVGMVRTAEGTELATGSLTVDTNHAPSYLRAEGATDHYAHTGLGWADVRATDGAWGPWVCGSLRPTATPELVRVLRASTLSGDWRGGELRGVLAVNTPGFPIHREALVASGLVVLPDVRPQARLVDGVATTLTAAGMVRRCPDCARRAAADAGRHPAGRRDDLGPVVARAVREALAEALGPMGADVARIERRTRHLVAAEAAQLRQRVTRL